MTAARLQIDLAMPQWEVIVDLLLQAPYAKVRDIVDTIQKQTAASRQAATDRMAELTHLRTRNEGLERDLQWTRQQASLAEEELRRQRAEMRKQRAPNGEAPRKRGRPRKAQIEAEPEPQNYEAA